MTTNKPVQFAEAKQDQLKKAVAQAALDYILPIIKPSDIIGVGTGSTANYFIQLLSNHNKAFAGAVSSSEASSALLYKGGIKIFDLNEVEELSVYIDGADETNEQLQLIKGGGAALTREKIVASCARGFVCIADESKWVKTLGTFPLPVEVIPMARESVIRQLKSLGGRPVHRDGTVTDNACDILDVYDLKITNPVELEKNINQIPGVITNGLFAHRPADVLLLGTKSGVKTLRATTSSS